MIWSVKENLEAWLHKHDKATGNNFHKVLTEGRTESKSLVRARDCDYIMPRSSPLFLLIPPSSSFFLGTIVPWELSIDPRVYYLRVFSDTSALNQSSFGHPMPSKPKDIWYLWLFLQFHETATFLWVYMCVDPKAMDSGPYDFYNDFCNVAHSSVHVLSRKHKTFPKML